MLAVRSPLNIKKGKEEKDTEKAKRSFAVQTVVNNWNVMMAITPKTRDLETVTKRSLATSVKETASRFLHADPATTMSA